MPIATANCNASGRIQMVLVRREKLMGRIARVLANYSAHKDKAVFLIPLPSVTPVAMSRYACG